MSAMIKGLAHGENETYGVANGTIDEVRYSLAAGSEMPAGLALNPDGSITGTPTAAGVYDIIVRVTSSGVVYGSSFSGTESATQSNFFKFTLTVGNAGESGSVEFKGEVSDKFTAVLTRNLIGKDREFDFAVNKELLKDEKANGRDLVVGVARNIDRTRRSFVAFLTFKADGTFTIVNARVALIAGSEIDNIEGTWNIDAAGNVTLTVTTASERGATIRIEDGVYTIPSDKK